MAYIVRTSRVGRSQGASIFWGLVSAFFAAAACFYFWKNHENEMSADRWREDAFNLQDQTEALNSQKDKLQASVAETMNQLKTREDLIQQKETELAAEESGLDEMGSEAQRESQANLAQVAIVKKFNDLIHKIGAGSPTDVVERGGRPVLRVPNAQLFAPGDAALTPAGKTLLNQIAQGLTGQIDNFELRIVAYTDTAAEAAAPVDPNSKTKPPTSWDLTASRAAAISRYFKDNSPLPFLNVVVVGRGDSEPIGNGGDDARNRRVEITIAPMPVAFHAPDLDQPKTPSAANGTAPATDTNSATPPAKKAKPKTPAKPDQPAATH